MQYTIQEFSQKLGHFVFTYRILMIHTEFGSPRSALPITICTHVVSGSKYLLRLTSKPTWAPGAGTGSSQPCPSGGGTRILNAGPNAEHMQVTSQWKHIQTRTLHQALDIKLCR